MHRFARFWPIAVLLSAMWTTPVRAAALFAQGGGEGSTPVVEYGVALGASALVLLVVCWPARRE